MTIYPATRPTRTRSQVLADLALTEGRIAALERDPRTLDSDTSASRILDWSRSRATALRLELTNPLPH